MTKDTMKGAAVAAENLLFDDWFDAIEDGVRARVRSFIEAMLEEELDDVLARPRYGRRKAGENNSLPAVLGCRHGHRKRSLTGTISSRPRGRDPQSKRHCVGSCRRLLHSVQYWAHFSVGFVFFSSAF